MKTGEGCLLYRWWKDRLRGSAHTSIRWQMWLHQTFFYKKTTSNQLSTTAGYIFCLELKQLKALTTSIIITLPSVATSQTEWLTEWKKKEEALNHLKLVAPEQDDWPQSAPFTSSWASSVGVSNTSCLRPELQITICSEAAWPCG